jgi:hypothetical protein
VRALLFGFALTLCVPACGAMVRTFTGRSISGNCDGACERYTDCKVGSTAADRARCLEECPMVFSDSDSIAAFESLECEDVVTYVDGDAPARADLQR